MAKKHATFGDLRSLLATRPVTASTWRKLARGLYFFEGPEDLEQVVLPYCVHALKAWPTSLPREAPAHWIHQDDGRARTAPLHPALGLATHITIVGSLTLELADAVLAACRPGQARALVVKAGASPQDALGRLLEGMCWENLRSLHVSNLPLTEDVTLALFAQPWLPELERLALHGGMYDRQLARLPDRFVRLRWLELNDNHLGEDSVLRLRAMESLGRLEALAINNNELERDAVELFDLPAASIPHDVWQEAREEHYWEVFE